jgi:hypothetical protein
MTHSLHVYPLVLHVNMCQVSGVSVEGVGIPELDSPIGEGTVEEL